MKTTLDKLPPLTKARRAKLKALATRPGREIDTSDIPEMTEEQWKERPARPLLSLAQPSDYYPRRCRCAGLAEGTGEGLPVSDQRHPPARDAERGEIGQVGLLDRVKAQAAGRRRS